MHTLRSEIDALFAGAEQVDDVRAEKLIDAVKGNLREAEKKVLRHFTTVLLLWLLSFGIAAGILEEASFLSIRPKDISVVLPALPPLIAWFFYSITGSIFGFIVYLDALTQILRNCWGDQYSKSLASLLFPPSCVTAEIMLAGAMDGFLGRLDAAWKIGLLIVLLLVPLVALCHASYLAIAVAEARIWVTIILLVLSGVIVARAVLLLLQQIYVLVDVSRPS